MKEKGLMLVLLVLAVSGCGSIDWFPKYQRQQTTPDQFTFTPKTQVALDPNSPSSSLLTAVSDPITVSGLTADSSPISVNGSTGSNSEYSVNGAAATASAGTVKNDDKVTVQNQLSNLPGVTATTTLIIGGVSAQFTSSTANVMPFSQSAAGTAGASVNSGAITLTVAPGTYQVTVDNGSYSFDNQSYFATEQTHAFNGGDVIYVRNIVPATTTVTIDGVASTFTSHT